MGFSAPPDPPVAAPTKPACCRRAKWLFPLALALVAAFFLLHGPHGCHHRHRFVPHPLPPAAEGGAPADTCDRLDCPPFKLAHQESDFEIRRYRAALWAETGDLLDASFDKATKRGFRRLFEYIQGRNKEEVHIPMTAPVLTSIKPSGGPFCSSSFTVKFFVPPSFSDDPPTPGEGLDVHIANLSARCVAVRRFWGATDFNVAQEAKLLADSLERTEWANITTRSGGGGKGAKGEKWEVYSIAQYNSPFELFNRVNEVWVPFEGTGKEGDECKPAAAVSALESAGDGASAGIVMATERAV